MAIETIAFVPKFAFDFLVIYMLALNLSRAFYGLLIVKLILTVGADFLLIPKVGVNGIAVTNIVVCSVLVVGSCAYLKRKGRLFFGGKATVLTFNKVREHFRIGKYVGLQVLVANGVYSLYVVRKINEVNQMDGYWVANAFIWGFLVSSCVGFK